MAIIVAFQWRKSPEPFIAALAFHSDTMEILAKPNKKHLKESYFSFRSEVKAYFLNLLAMMDRIHKRYPNEVIIFEYRILFNTDHFPYMSPSWKSLYVLKHFLAHYKLCKKRYKKVKLSPQLRRYLTGKKRQLFHRFLRKLGLVSQTLETRFEYRLWEIGFHITIGNCEDVIKKITADQLNHFWKSK